MWAVARNRLVHLVGGRWRDESSILRLLAEDVYQTFFDREGNQWIATGKSVYRLPAGQHKLENVDPSGAIGGIFTEAPDGSLWMSSESLAQKQGSVRLIYSRGSAVARSAKIKASTVALLSDTEGSLWIAPVNHGLLRAHAAQTSSGDSPQGLLLENYSHLDGLTSDSVSRILQDHAGNIWVSTNRGLDRFKQPRLIRYVDRPLPLIQALGTCADKETWVGTYGAPLLSIRDGHTFEHGHERKIINVFCDLDGAVWFTDDEGLWRYQSDHFFHIPAPEGVLPYSAHQVTGEGAHRTFVSFRRQGLWRFSDSRWTRVLVPGFPEDTPMSLLLDHSGRLWAGYVDNRVAVLEGDTGRTFSAGEAPELGSISVLLDSRRGILAGGTNGIALLRNDRFQPLLASDRAAMRGISGMLEAKNGDLWLNGSHGIIRIPSAEIDTALSSPGYTMQFESFAEGDIVGPAQEVMGLPTAVSDSTGRFWFSTSGALVSIDPASIPRNTIPPVTSISFLTADGVPLTDDRLRISPGTHTLRIGYFGVNLTNPERVTYRYKLDGEDAGWQEVGNRTEAVYTRLRPGAYTFHVMASNGEGVWSEASLPLQFTVLPAFYQRTWFLLLCLLLSITCLWGVIALRMRYLTGRIRERAEERADERIRIARDLHDTLLQSVQGLMLRFHLAAQQMPAESAARRNLDNALVAADSALQEGRDRVHRLRSLSPDSSNLDEMLATAATDLNWDNNVHFQLTTAGTPVALQPAAREELFYIGREALTNAFRHSHASKIRVELEYGKKALRISCSDNGRGIDPSILQSGGLSGHWGLLGMSERAEKIGATLEFRSDAETGTEIIVHVPAQRAYVYGLLRPWWPIRNWLLRTN